MIGILDSGIGGLSLVRMISEIFDGFDILFLGDTAKGPYGNKSAATVESYALQGIGFLLEKGARLIVLACHDISSCAVSAISAKYPVSLLNAVTPSVEEALKVSRFSKIGIIGSRVTVASGIYEKKIKEIQSDARVYSKACPLLIPIVEEGWFKKPETRMIVKKYIQPLKVRQIDTLIAASSYYFPLHETLKRKAGKRIRVIDSSLALCCYLETFLKKHPMLEPQLSRKNQIRFYVTDLTPHTENLAKRIYKRNCQLQQVSISRA